MNRPLIPAVWLALWCCSAACAAEFHVSGTTGNDANSGAASRPFRTISAAAQKAMPGDVITVHAGVYREWVKPPRGGRSDATRIVYQAAPGEKVVLTGSDRFDTWEKVSGNTWKLVLPNSCFGQFNPYAEKVNGDWFDGQGRVHRRGNVYLKGEWLAEAPNLDVVMKPAGQKPLWFSTVDGLVEKKTTLYAQFPAGANPNDGAVEVSMRPSVFTPEKTKIDYITLRGFEMRNAATTWAAPTAGQVGLVTAYWCKGWIIEDNEICYSRCCGVALGKYSDQWDGRRGSTEGYYLTIDDALKKDGWTRERIGGHIVRNNHIHHCGQTGIVGSLGCAFSQILGNDIHDCNMQGIWAGAEMAGIKFHGAIDVVISRNHIHHNGPAAGLWLDWMAQGSQITGNLFHDNDGQDLFTEVDHGPFLVANNLLLSGKAYDANSEGSAFAHNLLAGSLHVVSDNRKTPYHKPHSTELVGLHDCPLGDARWFNNLLAGRCSLEAYDKAGSDWACAMSGNVFVKGAQPSRFEAGGLSAPGFNAAAKLVKKSDGWYLTLSTDAGWAAERTRSLVTTELLGTARIPKQEFTNPDGSPVRIDTDYFGRPRNADNPFPGPFEKPVNGEIKVWALPSGTTPGPAS